MFELPKIRDPNIDPQKKGCLYKDTQEVDPQFVKQPCLGEMLRTEARVCCSRDSEKEPRACLQGRDKER